MKIDQIKDIFSEYDNTITVIEFSAIQLGCKNSNYVVNTGKGIFLLRISDKSGFNNEKEAYEIVKGKINIPDLIFHTTKGEWNIFVYQYINGVSLQKYIFDNGRCDENHIEQVAKTAAVMHNIPKDETYKLAELDVPSYEIWYKVFLDNPTVINKTGTRLHDRIQRLVTDKHALIAQIDSCKSFIHSDFRPINMIVDRHNKVYFIDWESAWWGHSLADIGQFFRYRNFFEDNHFKLFENTYNSYTQKKLPSNWIELSLFRDLVNPLQLLSIKQETPLRDADLIRVIEGTLAFWGY